MSRKNSKSSKHLAAPAAPADVTPVPANVDPAMLGHVSSPPAPIPRHVRTIGTVISGDRPDASPARTLSLADRFASLHVDPSPLMYGGALLNVTQPCVNMSAALLDPAHTPSADAPYVARPFTRDAAALSLAASLLDAAANIAHAPAPLILAVRVAFVHDRGMRPTKTRAFGYFDANRPATDLDLRASLARAAARLAGLPTAGLGTSAACDVTIPDLRASVASSLAALPA